MPRSIRHAVRKSAFAVFLAIALMLPEQASLASEAPRSYDMSEESLRSGFPQLTFLKAGQALVAYEPRVTVLVNKRRAELPRSHPLFAIDEFEEDDVLLMETALAGSEQYYVVFSEGPSADPMFYFEKVGSPSEVAFASLAGNTLAVPANGSVYTASRANHHFTKRRKFAWDAAGLREVRQPYYLVGLKTRTLKAIVLHDSPAGSVQVAQLPAGSDVEVLLTDDREDSEFRTCFLVKTPFGLLGWVWVPSSQYQSDVIEGISWWGD